tara:strand:+ start:302 stop:556 length:255 start_codon:yes stop_codon:yes gene_type:complete
MTDKEAPQELESTITLNDLVMCRNLIHIASKRGAFSAEEFSEIGSVYNKIDTFLKKNIKQETDETSETMNRASSSDSSENKMEI